MLGAALGLIVIGVVLLFLFPWAGIPLGIVGVILLVLYLVGFSRRANAAPGP